MQNFLLMNGPLVFLLTCLFILGAIVGSLVNVVIARLPYEKSIVWPGSRCFNCLQPLPFFWDNLPLVSYWLRGGRCRICRAPFSIRYFVIEFIVAIGFVLIFYLEVVRNIHHIPAFNDAVQLIRYRLLSVESLPMFWFFLHHALLFCLLVAAAACDLEDRSIPLGITVTGLAIGLLGAMIFPWPWPGTLEQAVPRISAQDLGDSIPPDLLKALNESAWELRPPKSGLYHWPVWLPPPNWLPAHSTLLGLMTGVVGALTGTFMLRSVKFLFEKGLGKEALGLGDADMMMMVGAFLGWQPTVVAFLVGAVVSLVFALPRLITRGDNTLPFGPGLAAGSMITWLGWRHIGPGVHVLFANAAWLALFVGIGAVLLFLLSYLMGRLRPKPTP